MLYFVEQSGDIRIFQDTKWLVIPIWVVDEGNFKTKSYYKFKYSLEDIYKIYNV